MPMLPEASAAVRSALVLGAERVEDALRDAAGVRPDRAGRER